MQPEKRLFPSQKNGEHVRLLIRKHWITDVRSSLAVLLIGFLPLLLGLSVATQLWKHSNPTIFWGFTLALLIYILFVSLITYVHWLNDELDIIVITDERIVSHEQIDLFHRQISETSVSQVQDVKGSEEGVLQSLLHYGRLEIMTASNDTFFRMHHVDHPYQNARRLLDIRDQLSNHSHDH